MPPRPFWKGYLKFSLVSCPVAMSPAITASEKIRFHTLNAKTGNRVRSRYVDAVTGEPVEDADQAKAYPVGEDAFVIVEDEELEALALDSTRTIDIETFAPADSIGWIWLDKPHHVVPDEKAGEEAYSVIREAMSATGAVGIAKLVLYRRERAVMIEPCGKGLVLWTLRYGEEVRDAEEYFASIEPEAPDEQALKLLVKLIEAKTKPWSPQMVKDLVQAKLRKIVEAKAAQAQRTGGNPHKSAPAGGGGKVVSIMDALKKSIESEKKPGRRAKD